MIDLTQIKESYPPYLHSESDQLLREYLQYKILEIIYTSAFGTKLVFLGGTCLRIAYQSERWSEDLDFDNQGLTEDDFSALSDLIRYQLGLLGYTVTTRTVNKGAFHCHIRFPGILYHYGLSGHKQAKILIKLDAERQPFEYQPHIHTLRKFEVACPIKVTPKDLLLSQKIAAAVGRKRPKGRDFYDIRFLLQDTTPNYAYLHQRFNVADGPSLRDFALSATQEYDFDQLAEDVAPFLFRTSDAEAVRGFRAWWAGVRL